jgi:dihydroorotase/N-acyl-D-amino-acid deacylase
MLLGGFTQRRKGAKDAKRFVAPLRLCVKLFLLLSCVALNAQTYDLLLKNGRIIDGTGAPWFRGDVAIQGDSIVRIAPSIDGPARRVVDVRGQVIAPGFIDLHNHGRRGIFDVPTAENCVRQGVTTLLEGPDGGSPVPLKPFFEQLIARKISVNMGAFIGQGSVRSQVVGLGDRKATPEEIEKMKGIVRQGMEDGAFGLSSGLFYVPGAFTPTDEVVELARVAGQMGGIYISHMRNEAAGVLDSVRETIAIGERGGLPTQITHHKIVGRGNWGKSVETLRLVSEARARGVDVSIDQYPYTASSTGLQQLIPKWALEGGGDALRQRLQDPALRRKIQVAVMDSILNDRGGGDPANVFIAACRHDPSLAGKNLAQITQERGQKVTLETAALTVIEIVEKGGASAIFHAIEEQDVQRIMQYPGTMIASDGEIPIFGRNAPHPRSYGTFARVLGHYVREKKLLTLEDAVRKMSSLPAARIGLTDRGLLRPGMKADIAVFDPATVRDAATFEKPHQYAEGVSLVVVNGEVVLDGGRMTDARPGRVLYGPGKR